MRQLELSSAGSGHYSLAAPAPSSYPFSPLLSPSLASQVDVEGAEFGVVSQWASASPHTSVLRRVDEILVEVHRSDGCDKSGFPTKTECDVRYVFEFFEALEAHGFRIFSQEPNLINGRRVAEFSLVKRALL